MANYPLDYQGLRINALLEKIDQLGPATDQAAGTMSAADKEKLNGMEAGAQENVIEKVKINGTELTPASKAVNITVDSEPTSSSPNPVSSGGVKAAIANFITNSVNDLVNYYLKSETYTKAEVQALIGAINQFHYEIYASIGEVTDPQGNVLYLIGPTGTGSDKYEEYVYANSTWTKIGDTTIDLSDYVTTTALNTALAAYTTSADLAALLAQKADKDTDAVVDNLASFDTNGNPVDSGVSKSDIPFLNRALGKYDAISETVLSQAKAGKYVDVNGAEVSAAGYGISAPIQLNFGDILLVPSASAVPAAVSVISRVVTRTYDKVINYAYTYREDYPELYNTATADYDPTLVYTAVYDTSGETPVLTGWTIGGQTLEELPATHEVTDSYYGPLFKQAVAAMPSTGYYIYLCPQAMEVVISGYTATVSGGTCLTVGLGIFKNIVSNFLARPGQDAVAQSLCDLYTLIMGLAGRLEDLGDVKAGTIDCENLPKVCGAPMVIEGVGAPSVLPHFVGQRYHDTTSGAKHLYEAFAVTGSTGDWVLIK